MFIYRYNKLSTGIRQKTKKTYRYLQTAAARRSKLSRYSSPLERVLDYGNSFSLFTFHLCFHIWFSHWYSFVESYDEGTLKWKSHDITNANTMQASRKFRKRCPCHMLRWSPWGVEAETAAIAVALLASLDCSIDSISVAPATLRATEWQISHILKKTLSRLIKKNLPSKRK